MERELVDKLHEFYGPSPTPIMRKHLEFALSNRTRGKKVIDQVVVKTGLDLRGKRVLDVGSGYGGFVIEAAARGAEAWGVELSGRLHEYGRLNARGEPGDIHLVHSNFLARRVLADLPRDFDLVLVNDVFEHVYDTAALLKQLHALMRDGAPFMFAIPNGDAVSAVEREGHNGTPGITLLAPNWWHKVVESYTAFYRPWSHYSGLFRAFGFERIDTWGPRRRTLDETRAEIADGLARAVAAVEAMELDDQTRPTMAAALAEYRARLDADLAVGDAVLLGWRYLQTFWKGCAYKGGEVFADVGERPRARPASPRGSAQVVAARARGLGQLARDALRRAGRRPGRRPEPAPTPAAPPRELTAVALARPVADLASRWCLRTRTDVSVADGAIRCAITGTDDAGGGQYGGVRLPIARPARLRIDLEVEGEPLAVYVDGEDGLRGRRLRWQWLRPTAGRHVIDLFAGADGDRFRAVEPTAVDGVAEVHVFARVAPGGRARLVLHRVEVAG